MIVPKTKSVDPYFLALLQTRVLFLWIRLWSFKKKFLGGKRISPHQEPTKLPRNGSSVASLGRKFFLLLGALAVLGYPDTIY